MSAKPFTVEFTARSVTFTFLAPVPGADYLQPTEQFRIPIKNWRELVAMKDLEPGRCAFCNFTPEQFRAHGEGELK